MTGQFDIGIMLGRLLQGQHQTEAKLDKLEGRVMKLEEKRPSRTSGIGQWIKIALQVAVPLATLWVTGSLEAALRAIK